MATLASILLTDLAQIHEFLQTQQGVLDHAAMTDLVTAQTTQVTNRLSNLRATPSECTRISSLIQTGPWPLAAKTAMCNAVNDIMNTQRANQEIRPRRANQEIRNFQNYITSTRAAILTSEATLLIKIHAVADQCNELNLTIPSEQSIKHIVAVLLCCGLRDIREPADMYNILAEFKKALRSRRRSMEIDEHIVLYPTNPDAISKDLQKQAYGDELPPPIRICPNELRLVTESIPLRITSKKIVAGVCPTQRTRCTQQGTPQEQMMTMFNMMQTMMQQSQSSTQTGGNNVRLTMLQRGQPMLTEGPQATQVLALMPPQHHHDSPPHMHEDSPPPAAQQQSPLALHQVSPPPAAQHQSHLALPALHEDSPPLQRMTAEEQARRMLAAMGSDDIPMAPHHGAPDATATPTKKEKPKPAATPKKASDAKSKKSTGKPKKSATTTSKAKPTIAKTKPNANGLGCSKCRYLKNGCGVCRGKARPNANNVKAMKAMKKK